MRGVRRLSSVFLVFLSILIFSKTTLAETVQMILEEEITPDIKVNALVIADSAQRAEVKEGLKQAVAHARETWDALSTEPLLKGHLTDQIAEELTRAGWENIFIDLGGVIVARGKDFNGAWKIPVVDDTTANAHHAFVFKTFHDIAVATINDHDKNVAGISSDLKSVTVFTNEGAAKAEELALAGFAAGLHQAQKMLKRADMERSVLIDKNGTFIRIPEE